MTTTPDFIYALLATSEETPPPPSVPTTASNPPVNTSTNRSMPPNPLHGCVKGMKVSTCPDCMGHIPRGKRFCERCGNKGFVLSKCGMCVLRAREALEKLVAEKRAEAQAEAQAEEGARMEEVVEKEANKEVNKEDVKSEMEEEDLMKEELEGTETKADEVMTEAVDGKEEEVGEERA